MFYISKWKKKLTILLHGQGFWSFDVEHRNVDDFYLLNTCHVITAALLFFIGWSKKL